VNTNQFLFLDPTIGNATGGTNTANVIAIDAMTGDAEVALNAFSVGALTGSAAIENAINIGSGWDAALVVNGTTVIAGDGTVQSAGIADDSITSAKIDDGTITAADLGTDSVDSDEIAAGAVD